MKTLLALALAFVVNLALFALMEQLGSARVLGFEEDALETQSLDVVKWPDARPAEDPSTPRESDEPDALQEPSLSPPQQRVGEALRAPAVPTFAAVALPLAAFAIRGRPSLGNVALGGTSLGGSSLEGSSLGGTSLERLRPIVRVNPEYPRRALARKIEGSVVVAYTILRDGSTAELEIVAADPTGVFDRSALEAVRRWRFEPQREPRRDRTTFEFELAAE